MVKNLKKYIDIYKIGSGDLTNFEVIREILLTSKPIILSTGLSDFKEIKSKVDSIPDDMSSDKKSSALNLIIERDNLNKKIEGKDPSLVVKEKERINHE